MTRSLTLILAATVPALGIGKNGTLPWNLKREMKYFRQVTAGGIVVMGRKTWDSIPTNFRPLKGRTNVVISSNKDLQLDSGVIAAESLEDALQKTSHIDGQVFIIGGAQLYSTAMAHSAAKNLLLTEIQDPSNSLECDRFFEFNKDKWTKQSDEALKEFIGPKVDLPSSSVSEDNFQYQFTLWQRQ